MRVERSTLFEATILRISGEIDFSQTHELLTELREVETEGCRQILVNLEECTLISSTAVGILVGWRCESSLHGRDFWVLCPSPEVREILDWVGVTQQLVRPEQSEREAVENLSKESTQRQPTARN